MYCTQPKTKIKCYLPENLDPNILDPEAAYFIHLLYRQRIYRQRRERPNDFVNLKLEYLRKQLGLQCRELVLNPLIDRGIVESDGTWATGYKATGYRLTSKYRLAKHREHELTDRTLLKRLNKWWAQETVDWSDHHHRMRRMLGEVSINHLEAVAFVEAEYEASVAQYRGVDTGHATRMRRKALNRYLANLLAITAIKDKDFFFKPDKYGRVHHNCSNLYTPLRQFLTLQGQSLVEVDICNSQPLLLGILAAQSQQKNPPLPPTHSSHYDVTFQSKLKVHGCTTRDIERYMRLTQKGRLYGYICKKLGYTTKDKAKNNFFRVAFDRPRKNPLDKLFPIVMAYANKVKEKDHKHLAHALQRLESRVMIQQVSQALYELGVIHVTVHDSILCLPHDVPQVKATIQQAFGLLNTKVTLKEKGQ